MGNGNDDDDDDDEDERAGTEDGAREEGEEKVETGGVTARSGPAAGRPQANRWRRASERLDEIDLGTVLRTRVPTFQSPPACEMGS